MITSMTMQILQGHSDRHTGREGGERKTAIQGALRWKKTAISHKHVPA